MQSTRAGARALRVAEGLDGGGAHTELAVLEEGRLHDAGERRVTLRAAS
jgi:hypothetical protein